MKFPTQAKAGRAGVALIMTLILVGVSIIILAGVMNRTQTVAILNQHNANYSVAGNVAESAVEKVFARMAYDFQSYGVAGVSNNMLNGLYKTNIPSVAESPYWANFQFSDPSSGNVGQTYVGFAYSYAGALPSAYSGLTTITAPVYRIVSNVVNSNAGYNVTGTAQADVLLALVPLTTWAIFYNGLLEFTQCATMSVNGPVMANGSIYVGTTASLTFNSGVTATGTLTAPNNVDGLSGVVNYSSSGWNTTFNNTPSYVTNAASVTVSLNMTNSHFLIDIPPAGESPTSALGSQRLYNQAQMILLVTNAPSGSGNPTVQLTIQNSLNGAVPGNDPAPNILYYTNASPGLLSSNLPFLSLTNTFYDGREYKNDLVTQIDIGRYATWAATNANVQGKLPASAGIYPTILYVADRRNVTATQLPVVRLANAAQLPANNNYGFTLATQNPLYTWGNYNTQIAGSSANAAASTTNTANTVPAALLSDSLTILSGAWTDSQSTTPYVKGVSSLAASDTTINAAILTGTMPTTDTTSTGFSGGVHNLPRLLEDWSSGNNNLWLNTSILRLWTSNLATNQFRNPYGFNPAPVNPYYNPPTRHYAFDLNFLNPARVPPGIPTALVPIRFAWGVPPPGSITYTPAHN
jgi:hypothetical protein